MKGLDRIGAARLREKNRVSSVASSKARRPKLKAAMIILMTQDYERII
jgi:hypothetical protein